MFASVILFMYLKHEYVLFQLVLLCSLLCCLFLCVAVLLKFGHLFFASCYVYIELCHDLPKRQGSVPMANRSFSPPAT